MFSFESRWVGSETRKDVARSLNRVTRGEKSLGARKTAPPVTGARECAIVHRDYHPPLDPLTPVSPGGPRTRGVFSLVAGPARVDSTRRGRTSAIWGRPLGGRGAKNDCLPPLPCPPRAAVTHPLPIKTRTGAP